MTQSIRIINLILFGFLLTYQTQSYAQVNPELLGVWQYGDSLPGSVRFKPDHLLIQEFKKDGSWTTWTYYQGRTPLHFKLTLKNHYVITSISPNKFQYTKNNKKIIQAYTIENGGLIFTSKRGKYISKIYHKKDFTDIKRNGSYQMHVNHAYEALIIDAIKSSKIKKIDKLLSSSKADFLKKNTSAFSYKNGSHEIVDRIWESAVKSGNIKIVAVLNANFSDFNSTRFITRIKRNSDPKMVTYLQKINIIDTALKGWEISGLDILLSLEGSLWIDAPRFFQKKIKQYGCVKSHFNSSSMTQKERLDDYQSRIDENKYWGNQISGKLKKNKKPTSSARNTQSKVDATAKVREFEKGLRLCFSNFLDNKPISKNVLNGITIPGSSSFTGEMTVLYYYSSGNKIRHDKSPIYAYTIIKVLLEIGADPNIKPSKKAVTLRERLAQFANHQRFSVEYKSLSDWLAKKGKLPQESQYKYDLITAEINLYNQIMKMIGGQPYGSTAPLNNVRKEKISKTNTSVKSTSSTSTAMRNKNTHPQINKKAKTGKVKTSVTNSQLVGCWNWSNGPHIVINKDGSVRNGAVNATWKYINKVKNIYSITWPSVADSLSLIKNGTQLYGINNLGFPILATRKSGTSSSLVGTWLWSNNITAHINSNNTVVAGHLKGTWHQSGKNWIIEWPIIDNIVVAKDGSSLTVKNQFGAVTAKRDVNCKKNN